jgi:hypothetical protein
VDCLATSAPKSQVGAASEAVVDSLEDTADTLQGSNLFRSKMKLEEKDETLRKERKKRMLR